MKTGLSFLFYILIVSFVACKKETRLSDNATGGTHSVTGKVTDASGQPLAGVNVIIEHTVWTNSYVFGTTDANGMYNVTVPAEPAGDWTAKAKLTISAYGQDYTFDLAPENTDVFKSGQAVVRNFTWKLSGAKPDGSGYYGAHVDFYQFGSDVPMDQVKVVFTPADAAATLIDGSPVPTFERSIEDVAGTFMVKDIPIGSYNIKAVYPGKTLLLKNRHMDQSPAALQPVVFGKNGYLGETEYNVEFWLSE